MENNNNPLNVKWYDYFKIDLNKGYQELSHRMKKQMEEEQKENKNEIERNGTE